MLSVFWLLLSSAPLAELVADKPKRSALNQLTRTLLRKNDCGVRPVQNWTSPILIHTDLIMQSVFDVDGKTQQVTTSIWYRQIWTDEFLVWDPEEFDGITEISLSSDAIWVPDLTISEFVDVGESPAIPYVYVNSLGMVKNNKPIQVVSACDLELYAFPFDKQNCTLTFRSWLHSVSEVNLTLWRSAEEIANDQKSFMDDGEWELMSVPSRYWQLRLDDRDYAHIQFNVLIRRRPLLYVVSLLIPSIFLMVVNVISFYLPPNSGTRITFKTSILLGYTVFRVNLMDEMPATAIRTPLIGVFFAVCMALLVLNLAISIFVVKLLHHNEKEVKEMSVSACLLDKYGSSSQTFLESNFTSVKTLGDVDQCGGYEFDLAPEELLSLSEPQESAPRLESLLQEVVALRLYLQEGVSDDSAQADWVALCCKVDLLLFRVYLLILVVYTSTLLLLWASWSSA
ncbi:5-hydroxytryptamine receptor 3A-like [Coregonus clupeaformis]|uniref:5-hydroxytryptamine receptor 3A-like n=1 Tax=Coregonus clupeaformis TaxID=59861 RepID=UPI001E1C36AA|nr:5-hydroxytryptamine receptor 3A-like [Coregonus clupeaformis]